ncbi:hypothetical protein B0H19DRAFT_78903 [Mycena capillaripes]|nr:hypothetical protein B0H19DRAFT_78903 [Mycena capillaripes]
MASPKSPLAVQELIDYCLDFLHASPPDLKRCALVGRNWTKSAQMHLFNHIVIGSAGDWNPTFLARARTRCRLLCEVLDTSPRLLRLVESLQIHLDTIPPDALSSFANLSFPCLRRIFVSGNWMPASAILIQELFSLGTLTAISISGNFASLSAFTQILGQCSTSITNVSFCSIRTPTTIIHGDPSDRRIEVYGLDLWWSSGIHDWLNSPQCPFDFSNLRRLRLNENTSLPQWPAFAPSIPRVEHLQFQPQVPGLTAIDFAPFTNLQCIEIFIEFRDDVSSALHTLSTIARTNHIQTIRFRLTHTSIPNAESGAEMDRALSTLPIPHLRAVELVYITSPSPTVAANLPLLNARRLLRVVHGASAYDSHLI